MGILLHTCTNVANYIYMFVNTHIHISLHIRNVIMSTLEFLFFVSPLIHALPKLFLRLQIYSNNSTLTSSLVSRQLAMTCSLPSRLKLAVHVDITIQLDFVMIVDDGLKFESCLLRKFYL